jgi:hypothetical protein
MVISECERYEDRQADRDIVDLTAGRKDNGS